MNDTTHLVLDETVMAAAGRGNVLASQLIHRAHAEAGWYLYAPACVLVEADRARPGTAEHFAALPGITVLDLDLPAVLAVAQQNTWAAAHTRHAAQPTLDRPDRAIVEPQRWQKEPVRILDLSPRHEADVSGTRRHRELAAEGPTESRQSAEGDGEGWPFRDTWGPPWRSPGERDLWSASPVTHGPTSSGP